MPSDRLRSVASEDTTPSVPWAAEPSHPATPASTSTRRPRPATSGDRGYGPSPVRAVRACPRSSDPSPAARDIDGRERPASRATATPSRGPEAPSSTLGLAPRPGGGIPSRELASVLQVGEGRRVDQDHVVEAPRPGRLAAGALPSRRARRRCPTPAPLRRPHPTHRRSRPEAIATEPPPKRAGAAARSIELPAAERVRAQNEHRLAGGDQRSHGGDAGSASRGRPPDGTRPRPRRAPRAGRRAAPSARPRGGSATRAGQEPPDRPGWEANRGRRRAGQG